MSTERLNDTRQRAFIAIAAPVVFASILGVALLVLAPASTRTAADLSVTAVGSSSGASDDSNESAQPDANVSQGPTENIPAVPEVLEYSVDRIEDASHGPQIAFQVVGEYVGAEYWVIRVGGRPALKVSAIPGMIFGMPADVVPAGATLEVTAEGTQGIVIASSGKRVLTQQ